MLVDLVSRHLRVPDVWAAAAEMLPDFAGTVPELLATAEAMTTRTAARHAPEKKP
ncbi:hypothetical protein [Yinghuangia seranimata]|uniref:hypothetical protein n=1 Tax=Yinghuangia seranimata TaxID=408067 RepID=UPI00248ADE49|nr:hypothetical protein [Yinghuangia seranimata]MDI2125740.1 hypothetical protein [Yinghuangia seranimata]